jgi:hypothetical protein
MKTYAEMKARYDVQEAERKAKFERRVEQFTADWIAALETRIDSAFHEEDPQESVSVSSNSLEASVLLPKIEYAVNEAAERVRHHFLDLGFNADSPFHGTDWSSVTIRWVF